MSTVNLENKTILVTGAAGFIGSNLVKRIYEEVPSATVIGIDNMNAYYDVALKEFRLNELAKYSTFTFVKGNIADNGNDLPKTIISREYSSEWKPGDEPYYPVNDAKNSLLYSEYKKLADAEGKVIFGGRLGEYKYYDMDQVIAAVLDKCASELGEA